MALDKLTQITRTGISSLADVTTSDWVFDSIDVVGNASIGGTITYQDVTNVDSVGVATFRKNVQVGAGLSVVGVSTFNDAIGIGDSIIHLGNTDTSIRFPSADTFTVETAGSERLRIDSSGRLLIGTTTEGLGTYGEDLTIGSSDHAGITLRTGTGHKGTIYFSDGTSGAAEYKGSVQYDHSDDSLRFASAGSERLRIQSNGRVGVGTASARAFLDLCGAAENATLLLDSIEAILL